MADLHIDLFTHSADFEQSQYEVLAALQRTRHAYAHNCVYPHLGDLLRLRRTLRPLLDHADALRRAQPGRITGIDWHEQKVLYEDAPREEARPLHFEDLALWVMPLLDAAIREGQMLCEFVDENSTVEPVGLVPTYQQEGYLLVPDTDTGALRAIRYTVSILSGHADERYRSLRTAPVRLDPDDPSPSGWKRALIAHNPDLPNPATFRLHTDLEDFPTDATLLPVAKRKLLHHLALGGVPGIA